MIPDMHAILLASMEHRAANPEGVTVRVLTTDALMAGQAAVLLAARLFPDRTFGAVLFMEPDPSMDAMLVTVEDRGPRRFTNRSGIPAPTR